MKNLFTQAALGWWLRRIIDWGGWLGTIVGGLVGFWAIIPAPMQEDLLELLQGRWQEITLKSAVGFVVLVFAQWRSFRATTKQQIVTEDGKKIDTKADLPRNKKVLVDEIANVAADKKKAERKPNLLDKLFGR